MSEEHLPFAQGVMIDLSVPSLCDGDGYVGRKGEWACDEARIGEHEMGFVD